MSFQQGSSHIAQLLNTWNAFSGGKSDRKEAVLSQVRDWLTVGSRLCTKLALGERQPYKVGSPENEILTYLLNIVFVFHNRAVKLQKFEKKSYLKLP